MTAPVLRQGVSFVVIGLAATAVHVALALASRRFAAASALQANLIGYSGAVLVSYFGNARFTFRSTAMHGPQFARFLAVSLFGLALNQAITFLAVKVAGLPFLVGLGLVVTIVPVVSFALSRAWAFRSARQG